jgi:hypothetical protein
MPGVLLGIRGVAAHPGLTVGLEGYLDLSDGPAGGLSHDGGPAHA